jgi:hypothetical protein
MKVVKEFCQQTTNRNKLYDRFFVYVPTYVARDKDFPFKTEEEVVIRIENGKLVIEKG